MPSNWNTLTERQAAAKLTQNERKVIAAVARRTLGWAGREQGDRISARQIAAQTGLDRRDVGKALHALIDRQIILSRGGRERTVAILSVNVDPLTPWLTSRPKVHLAVVAPPDGERKAKKHLAVVAPPDLAVVAPPRNREGVKHKTPAAPDDLSAFLRDVYDAYQANGGRLQLVKNRSALGASAKRLVLAGVERRWILAAAGDLGRNQEFTGLLKQRVEEIIAKGGICQHEGLERKRIATSILLRCACPRCLEAAEWRKEQVEKANAKEEAK